MAKRIRYNLAVVPPASAGGQLGATYAQMRRDLLLVPEPFLMHSVAPDILAGVWSKFRESLIAGQVDRGLKEAVAATVAGGSGCAGWRSGGLHGYAGRVCGICSGFRRAVGTCAGRPGSTHGSRRTAAGYHGSLFEPQHLPAQTR